MTAYRNIIILPATGCRRSQRMLSYLQEQQIPFMEIPLTSPEGQALMQEHDLRASPGILVDGQSVNPFDVLIRPDCKVDEAAVRRIFQRPANGG
ncbi:MAG TPA: hypothetical protein DCL15_20075 [Chloroflexi bacterium]|nr:hypothetical protein [Chloroflexota bacterium]HHW87064.1 hypothetical protein [Chloroflexota bacterium]